MEIVLVYTQDNLSWQTFFSFESTWRKFVQLIINPTDAFGLQFFLHNKAENIAEICTGNSMICSDIWHKYHEWYFKIVIRNLRQFWNITSGIYAKYHVQILLLFVTRKRFVIFYM